MMLTFPKTSRVLCSVVTVSLFSRSVSVSINKLVVGLVSVFIRVYQVPLCGDVQFGAMGERVMCVSGAYCHACEVVK